MGNPHNWYLFIPRFLCIQSFELKTIFVCHEKFYSVRSVCIIIYNENRCEDFIIRSISKCQLKSIWSTHCCPATNGSQTGIGQVRYGGIYAGAARRRVHLATVLLRPPSGHRPGRRQARHTPILQIGLRLAIAQADARPAMPASFR